MVQMVKSLPAMWKTGVWSPGWEDPLEKEIATHSGILAWKNPMDRGARQAAGYVVEKGRRQLSNWACMHINTSSIYTSKKEIWSTTQENRHKSKPPILLTNTKQSISKTYIEREQKHPTNSEKDHFFWKIWCLWNRLHHERYRKR